MKSEGSVKLGQAFVLAVNILLAFVSVGCVSAATVCPSGCDYTSIQAAIEAADAGDTIEVHSGTYCENVDVDKPLFLRGVDTGGGKPVVDAGGSSSSAITLSADWITLAGFGVINSGDSGVQINANHNNITGNIASNNEAGIILSDYSNNNIIASNTLSGNEDGIALGYFCDYNSVTGNTICNNNDGGIVLAFTSNNTITHNTVCNNEDGIYLRLTSDNKIYLNDFMNNSVNVDSMKSANIWDSPETIAYQYDSSNFTNYLGNFWDDYSGFDADNDGIGDTFYSIASDKDNYPLMQPWENYFVTVSAFDTCPGTYPSLMGTHTGTITPSRNLTVSKLYTYPCAGTGGHTESIKLYGNGTLIANGTWTGYQSDGHNITINPSVILQAGHTYNYTIVTGSYPQILHTTSKEVTGGTITCSSFVDANGNIYTDWIPAIRLG